MRPQFGEIRISLRKKVKLYLKRANEIEQLLNLEPESWGRYQQDFNKNVNLIFQEIMDFEKDCLANNNPKKILKLKEIFLKRFKHIFRRGVYGPWSMDKPFGYAGDFKIIEDIYKNLPITTGFDRLFDNYFMASAISVSVRNRKEDFKKIITEFARSRKGELIKIMNLASGPCREIYEFLKGPHAHEALTFFDCYENDINAINFSRRLLYNEDKVNFFQTNALRLAAAKEIRTMIRKKYDLVYSTGLFDYFSDKISVKLISNLKNLLRPGGMVIISNVTDRYKNPSVHYMEWAGQWVLVYRTSEKFKEIFIEAGFDKRKITLIHERTGVMQYIKASV